MVTGMQASHAWPSRYLRTRTSGRPEISSAIEVSEKGSTRACLSKYPRKAISAFGKRLGVQSWLPKSDESCVAVEVPANGYLSSSGHNWDCERSYKKGGGSCVAVEVPANAHVDYSGHDWKCDAGYRRQGGKLYCAERVAATIGVHVSLVKPWESAEVTSLGLCPRKR